MRHYPEPDPGSPDTTSPRHYLSWLVAHHRPSVLLATFYGVVCTVAQALVPAAVGRGIEHGLIAQDKRALVLWSATVLGLGIVQAASGTLRDRSSLTNRFGANYRTMQLVTRQASRLGVEMSGRVSSGAVVSVSATDITRIGSAVESTARGGGAVVSIVVVAAIMLTSSWQLGLVALIGVPLIAWAVARLMRLLHDRQHHLRDQQGALSELAVDIIQGLRVLRGIGGEGAFADRYRERSQKARHEGVRVAAVGASVAAGQLLLPGLLVTAIVWLGAYLVGRDELGPGALVAFYGYAVFLAEQLRRTTTMVDQVTRALVASRQVIDFLTLKPALTWGQEKFPESPANAVLHDPEADLTVPAGRFVAVVCTSTADAHTVSDRLCRYGASQVTCGGQPLSAFPAEDVRRRVVLMDHRSRLFSGRLGSELDPVGHDDPGRLERALEAAAARDIVDALPDGLDQQITGSREFSGGQRQRLSLARVLALDPDTLILVEPTSALDAHTEGHIAQRLGPARTGKSTVVFTTSPILLDHVEHVIYMDQGRVVAQGSHDGLLDLDGYRTVVTRESALS